MKIVKMDAKHAEIFCNLRMQLFHELKEIDLKQDNSSLSVATTDYYNSHIDTDLLCWGIELENDIVAIASLCLFTRIPYAENLSGKEGYLLNVYTLQEFRRRGFSKLLVDTVIDYARSNHIGKLWLNSSPQGKSIYQQCGFVESDNEMVLFL